jgi:hypothetical protein
MILDVISVMAYDSSNSLAILEKVLFSRSEEPFGTTFEEWSIRWWKWLISIPQDQNPALDSTGQKFSLAQPYSPVIFLPGTFEGHAERKYTISPGNAIFFPVVNFITSFTEEPRLKEEHELVSRANEDIASLTNVVVNIDGVYIKDIKRFRVQSPVFELVYPESNVFQFKEGHTKAISDGYWIFIKGLQPGRHEIKVSGCCYSGRTKESTDWHLEVV